MDLQQHILDDEHNVIKVPYDEYVKWFVVPGNKIVKQEDVGEDLWVSTVFLGINHGFRDVDLWFETMVFNKDEKGNVDFSGVDMDRYTTWDKALEGHKRMVEKYSKE